jgi:UDP-glucose 4-epimerase
MLRVIVTGASGFIGKNLCNALIDLGIEFIGTDLKPHNSTILELDLRDSASPQFIAALKPELIIHLAAQIDVNRSLLDPKLDLETNILGTLNLVSGAISGNAQHIIYISSGGAIYAQNQHFPIKENGILGPRSPYGISKLAGELYVKALSEQSNVQWTSLALSNCYGLVTDQQKGVIFNFWKSLVSNESIFINGQETSRDFIHVDDVVHAILLAMDKPTNCRVNISTGRETTLETVFNLVSEKMGRTAEASLRPLPLGELTRSCLDNSLARDLLGWEPKILISDGIDISIP